jgi:hypothetical protein
MVFTPLFRSSYRGPIMTFRLIEFEKTRDEQVPLRAGDTDFDYGWRCIPVPPPGDGYGKWEIFDTRHDYKTKWVRFRARSIFVRIEPITPVSCTGGTIRNVAHQ